MSGWAYRLSLGVQLGVCAFCVGCVTSSSSMEGAIGRVVWKPPEMYAFGDCVPEGTDVPMWRHLFPMASDEQEAKYLENACRQIAKGEKNFSTELGLWFLGLKTDDLAAGYAMLWDRILLYKADKYRREVERITFDVECSRLSVVRFCIYMQNEAKRGGTVPHRNIPRITIEYRGDTRDTRHDAEGITLQKKGVSLTEALDAAATQLLGTARRNYRFYSDRVVVSDYSCGRPEAERNPILDKVVWVANVDQQQLKHLLASFGKSHTESERMDYDYRKLCTAGFGGTYEAHYGAEDLVVYDASQKRLIVVGSPESLEPLASALSQLD